MCSVLMFLLSFLHIYKACFACILLAHWALLPLLFLKIIFGFFVLSLVGRYLDISLRVRLLCVVSMPLLYRHPNTFPAHLCLSTALVFLQTLFCCYFILTSVLKRILSRSTRTREPFSTRSTSEFGEHQSVFKLEGNPSETWFDIGTT